MESCALFCNILTVAPTAIIGAIKSTRKPIIMASCTCCTSFVERVIRLAVENLFISSKEKPCILENIKERARAEKPAPTREAM